MTTDYAIPFWLLVASYWLHLLATVVWLGGLVVMSLVAWPAVRRRVLTPEVWAELQRRLTPLTNTSLVILLITGFIQMTADPNYEGFLQVRTLWAQAILVKHLAFLGMVGLAAVMQWRIQPALARLSLLAATKPQLAAAEREKLTQRELHLLRWNLLCAAAVLLCTAVATAV
ncbi:MAG: hypothetical protein AB1791_12455 [Chloroflexota bacterium]